MTYGMNKAIRERKMGGGFAPGNKTFAVLLIAALFLRGKSVGRNGGGISRGYGYDTEVRICKEILVRLWKKISKGGTLSK